RRGVAHLGAGWDREVEVGPRLAGHVLALPVLPPLGLPLGAIAIIQQRREVHVGAHEHTTACAALPAVGPALGDELFAAKRGGSRSTRPTDDVDHRTIYKHPRSGCGVRSAECGVERWACRAVLIDDTVIARICSASRRSSETRSASRSPRSRRSPSQNSDSSASSSTIPILAMKSLRERA